MYIEDVYCKKREKVSIKDDFQLLYPYAGVMGLFFPIGRLENGGTCEFATPTCLKKCCVKHKGHGTKIGFDRKNEIYQFFLNNSVDKIKSKILKELRENNCKIFTWFSSGDCPTFLTSKYYFIIKGLVEKDIIQTGVTRNTELWKKCQPFSPYNCKVLLTVEKINDVINFPKKSGLYSIPNYKKGIIDIYNIELNMTYKYGGCGGRYYEYHIKNKEKEIPHQKLDCTVCWEKKIGCFTLKK